MNTQLLPASKESTQKAVTLLQAGELVAFPTETVYGLGADALNSQAVEKIFLAKGRPSDNPLIVHIASREQLLELVSEIPPLAEKLMRTFWPGPLTLVFPRSSIVPNNVTAGGETVAIRWPSHEVAQQLIQEAQRPIAAPSANLSGKPSPTQAVHVLEDLNGKIPLILDGGPTQIGLESTVVDVTTEKPVLLRNGAVSQEMIENVLKQELITSRSLSQGTAPKSPGMKYRHYAPKARVIAVQNDSFTEIPKKSALLTTYSKADSRFEKIISFRDDEEMAAAIFAVFRELDAAGIQRIYVRLPQKGALVQALSERVGKASAATSESQNPFEIVPAEQSY